MSNTPQPNNVLECDKVPKTSEHSSMGHLVQMILPNAQEKIGELAQEGAQQAWMLSSPNIGWIQAPSKNDLSLCWDKKWKM